MTRNVVCTMLLAVLFLTLTSTCLGRIWTDRTGRQVEAELISVSDGYVKIKRQSDGKVFDLPLDRLSDDDRAFLRAQGTLGNTPSAEPAVGVKKCDVFSGEEMTETSATLTAGAKVTVVKSLPDKVQVRTASGTNGWVRRCALCSQEEYSRRTTASEVPENLICVGSDKGGMFMYGGSVPIRMNEFVFDEPGQGIWMDASAKGKDFRGLRGDPSILFLYRKNRSVAKLPIWQDAPTQPKK